LSVVNSATRTPVAYINSSIARSRLPSSVSGSGVSINLIASSIERCFGSFFSNFGVETSFAGLSSNIPSRTRNWKNVSLSGCSDQRIVPGPNATAASATSVTCSGARGCKRTTIAQVARYAAQFNRIATDATRAIGSTRPNCGSSGPDAPSMSALAVAGLAATRAPLRRCSSLMPPAWSKWTCELTISFTSSTLKPSVRMLAAI